jgi:predicted lysophospholipase L1 biosynthesis ABC-type transport system permease subunit
VRPAFVRVSAPVLAACLAACGGDGPSGPPPERARFMALGPAPRVVLPFTTDLRIEVEVYDSLGEPLETPSRSAMEWSSSDESVAGDPDAMAEAVREAIWAVDRDQPVWKIRSMASLLDRDLAPRRFTARLTAGFAVLALLLALIGVYGVMSYVVAQRTREIGIRMALGAARGEVVRLVLGRGLRIVAAGTGLGLVAAYAGARVIERQLFGVPAADLATFVSVPLVLLVVAAVACWVPARRAARVDPAIALSAE